MDKPQVTAGDYMFPSTNNIYLCLYIANLHTDRKTSLQLPKLTIQLINSLLTWDQQPGLLIWKTKTPV